jgi:hypothetical protein
MMHVVTRRYSGPGAKELMDLVMKNKDEVEKLMRGVNGFVRYLIVKTGDGWMSATVCQDKAGCDKSVQIAKDWVGKNATSTGVGAPHITEGEVLFQILA